MNISDAREFVQSLIDNGVEIVVDMAPGREKSYRVTPIELDLVVPADAGETSIGVFFQGSNDGTELMEFIDYLRSGCIRLVAK